MFALNSISHAQNINTDFQTSATLQKTCNVKMSNIEFGIYNSEVDNFASSNINVLCSKNTSYILGINYYPNGYTSAQFKSNNLKFSVYQGGWFSAVMYHSTSSNYLLFNLFQDSGYTKVFGDSTTTNLNWSGLGSEVSIYKISNGQIQSTPLSKANSNLFKPIK